MALCETLTEVELVIQAVRESEERLRTLCEQSRDGVALVVDGKIEYANPAWLEISGYSPEDIEGHSHWSLSLQKTEIGWPKG